MQTTTIIIYITSFAMVFALSWISKTNNNHTLFNDEGDITKRPGNLVGIHLAGIMWLGLTAVIQINLSVVHVLLGYSNPEASSLFIFVIIYLLAGTVAFRLSKNIIGFGIIYHDIKGQLSQSFFKKYFIIRTLYLSVYELWFRGFLLFETIKWLGIPAAVSLNILLYTLLHIFKSKKEIIGCIPFGLVLCCLSILFNAAWPAIILHTTFSFIYELNLYRNYIDSPKTVRS